MVSRLRELRDVSFACGARVLNERTVILGRVASLEHVENLAKVEKHGSMNWFSVVCCTAFHLDFIWLSVLPATKYVGLG